MQQDGSFFQNDLLRRRCLQRQLRKHSTVYWVVSGNQQRAQKTSDANVNPHTPNMIHVFFLAIKTMHRFLMKKAVLFLHPHPSSIATVSFLTNNGIPKRGYLF